MMCATNGGATGAWIIEARIEANYGSVVHVISGRMEANLGISGSKQNYTSSDDRTTQISDCFLTRYPHPSLQRVVILITCLF